MPSSLQVARARLRQPKAACRRDHAAMVPSKEFYAIVAVACAIVTIYRHNETRPTIRSSLVVQPHVRRKGVAFRRAAVRMGIPSVPAAASSRVTIAALVHVGRGRKAAQAAGAADAAAGETDDHAAGGGAAAEREAVFRAVSRYGGRAHAHAVVIVKFAGRLLLVGVPRFQFRQVQFILVQSAIPF